MLKLFHHDINCKLYIYAFHGNKMLKKKDRRFYFVFFIINIFRREKKKDFWLYDKHINYDYLCFNHNE